MNDNILVTGGTGFVGNNLLAYLKPSEFKTSVLSRKDLETSGIDRFEGITAIIHLAGKAHDLKKTADEAEYFAVNYGLTKKLYDNFLKSDVKKFIYISSVKAVADELSEVLTEDHIPDPKTAYGRSKLSAEEYITSCSLPADKSYYILRPCMIHGPGNKGNLNLLYQLIKMGIPYPLAGYNNKRSFLSVENLCFVIQEILQRYDIPSGIYNISDDDSLSTSEVVFILSRAINKKPKMWKIKPSFIEVIAKLGDSLHLPLTTERLRKLTENYIVDNGKIRKTLGKELPLSSKLGLRRTAEHFINKK